MNRFSTNHKWINEHPDQFAIQNGFCRFSGEYIIKQSKEEMPGLVSLNNGIETTIHSSYYPDREAKRFSDKVKSEKDNILLCGMGLGYHLKYIAERFPARKIILVEPDKHLFNLALHYINLEELENIRFIIGYEDFDLTDFIDMDAEYDIVSFTPCTRGNPEYYASLEKQIKKQKRYSLSDDWKYKKFTSDQLRIVYIDSAYVLSKECVTALQKLGHRVQYIHIDRDNYDYREFVRNFLKMLAEFRPDFVLTVNHLGFDKEGRLTEMLSEMEVPYASWYVDSPTVVLSNYKSNLSEYCNIFVWDRDYIEDVKGFGYDNVDYLPLATSPEIFHPMDKPFRYDVSFVGSSMVYSTHKNTRSFIFRQDLLTAVDVVAKEFLSMDTRYVSKAINSVRNKGIRIEFEYYDQQADFEAAVLWRATQMYRLSGITKLAEFYPMINGDPNWDNILDNRFRIGREIMYYDNLCEHYNASKINFNMTSRQMKNAVNQRVFDVPACGKFIISDYKSQLDEIFDRNEVVYFNDVEEIPELIRFYLENDTEREKIAEASRLKILNAHTYRHRLAEMISILRKRFGRI